MMRVRVVRISVIGFVRDILVLTGGSVDKVTQTEVFALKEDTGEG
jgi:hypothetical protein